MCIAISHPCSGRRRRRPKQSNSNSLLRIHHQYHLLLHTHTRGTDGGGIEGGRSPATAKGREQAAAAAGETNRTLTSLPLLSHTLSPPSCGCCMNWTEEEEDPSSTYGDCCTHIPERLRSVDFLRPPRPVSEPPPSVMLLLHMFVKLSRSVLLLSLRAPLFSIAGTEREKKKHFCAHVAKAALSTSSSPPPPPAA